jgi:hypothetical protein
MNLLQMICCAFLLKGDEFYQRYSADQQQLQQRRLRPATNRWLQTATLTGVKQDILQLLTAVSAEGKETCECETAAASPSPSPSEPVSD